ncbi:MAG: FAD-dependent oxidoreductase [Acidimicrobiales bacterium]|nr:FAD-dependent oxidoreductase [Acidimicrobiales bacterium]
MNPRKPINLIPEQARVVIIGGGVHGASLLWHLAQEGWTDTVLVEKAELTSGSTWHAAGQITRSVADYTTAAFHHYAIELYEELEALTGQAVSFHQPGGLRVAYTDHEVDALRSQLGVGRYIGYPIELISPSEAAQINPFYDFTDAKAVIWTEGEGHVDPSSVTMAFANSARAAGATISRRNRVTNIEPLANGEWEVVTEKGTITCEHVVDAAGCYAHQVGQFTGLAVPQANVLHHYLVTDEVPEFVAAMGTDRPEIPVMRDNRVAGYIRQEQTAGLIGIYEHAGAESIWDSGVPWEAENPLFPADYDKIAPWLTEAFERIPVLADVGIKRVVHGAITHTTDAHMLLGPAPDHRNFWLNTGSSIGLAWGPGAGRELARWIVHGQTELSLRHYDPRRYSYTDAGHNDAFASNRSTASSGTDYIRRKAIEDYEWMFRVHPPGEERQDHRPVWVSALYDTLSEQRAIHTQAYGWEQPKWFVPEGQPFEDAYGWRRPGWYDAVRAECAAARERVALLDLSAFTKMDIVGPDAHEFLNHLTTGIVPTTHGRIALNYVLTPTGRVETEITLTCLGDNRYYLVSGPVSHQRDLDWLRQHTRRPDGTLFDVDIMDRTRENGTLVVAGPNARELLRRCSDTDMSGEAFGFLRAQELRICDVEVKALRVGFTGSLGWELHAPMNQLLQMYTGLLSAGADLGVANIGSHALNSLRMEKAYLTRFELTHDITPYQAGVDRWVRPERKDFIGREALLSSIDAPATGSANWNLVYLHVHVGDNPGAADCVGGEGVFVGETAIGLTTSGAYGFTVNRSLAFAYVHSAHSSPGTELTVLILGETVPATVLDLAAYDPGNHDLRG